MLYNDRWDGHGLRPFLLRYLTLASASVFAARCGRLHLPSAQFFPPLQLYFLTDLIVIYFRLRANNTEVWCTCTVIVNIAGHWQQVTEERKSSSKRVWPSSLVQLKDSSWLGSRDIYTTRLVVMIPFVFRKLSCVYTRYDSLI